MPSGGKTSRVMRWIASHPPRHTASTATRMVTGRRREALTMFTLTLLSLQHFVLQLCQAPEHDLQHLAPRGSQQVFAARLRAGLLVRLGLEPAVHLHPPQHGVKRAGAHVVSVLAQLMEHPLPDDRPLGGVM